MRIGELSTASGVPVPSIKYYLREGLLPPGELTSPNQARYDERHIRRLRLIRALLDVGGLSVAAASDVLAALDRPATGTHKLLGTAQRAVSRATESCDAAERTAATAEVQALLGRLGWHVPPTNPAVPACADVVAALRRLGQLDFLASIDDYARAADAAAVTDLKLAAARPDPDAMAEAVVLGTVLGDALLSALRRLAQASRSAEMFGGFGESEGEAFSPLPNP